ncbi:HAD family hydrolase [Nesterenkonia sp. F]|uniref:HAD family hydrolase n=1 Tax=Nesterenkonia sp. F TaxID=795955 RepID=UPI000255CFEF|nr:HAD family hydrolase [Nesterenkonia sp. F]
MMSTPTGHSSPSREQLLLLDFDGTVCLGDDPVLHYAAQVDALLADRGAAERDDGGTAEGDAGVRDVVAEALAAGDLHVPELSPGVSVQDGYQLVQRLGLARGLSVEEAGVAFRAGREALLTAGLHRSDVHAPAGLAALLDEVRETAAVVLITNSPAAAFAPWLEVLGLTGAFDAVVNDAGKPAGLPAALEEARRRAGAEHVAETQVLSIGDIWENDLAPVAARGGTTVLIDRFGAGVGTPDHRVPDLAAAAPILRHWAAAPHSDV